MGRESGLEEGEVESPGDHAAGAMPASDNIEGLIKWAQREPWVDDFDAEFERHCGPASRHAGVAFDELADAIGADLMMALWGWVFEDFVSSRRGERNVADDYLKRRGWKESAGARAYMRALRNSTVSLYEVSDVVVGESFLARDLVRGGEPVRVTERTATRTLRQWDRIAARIVTVLGKTALTGGLLPFPRSLAEDALARIERVRKNARAEGAKFARSLGRNVSGGELAQMAGVDEVLAGSAFMLSNLWLADMLRRALAPSLPKMQNTDGEPFEFITVHIPLASEASAPAIVAGLDAFPALRKDSDSRWTWLRAEERPRASPRSGRRPAPRRWRTAASCSATSSSRPRRSPCRSIPKPAPPADAPCSNRLSRGSCAPPSRNGKPSSR